MTGVVRFFFIAARQSPAYLKSHATANAWNSNDVHSIKWRFSSAVVPKLLRLLVGDADITCSIDSIAALRDGL
ncbi:hypothetical protein BCR37DRAFT_413495 [Protomyces lactucae-debilis]|uniref:Uncharacterized protein n=1 Tax=Protomyces lactucae-debilis TaxID=2754530 RepID=A0A1Y2FF48_PROLT|nr:uncharacterized protein BCR37DRAFT_413495 [Protomyces lactucae-debilis]ORY82568.1 hypothetical protein BCR37DRAFT_413495 [Protomyces lactucae-debilis]